MATRRSAALAMDFLQRVAQTCNCVVVSVDYRLAPETRFPGSLEDNYTGLRWLYNNADALGVDRKRIAVGGRAPAEDMPRLWPSWRETEKRFPSLFSCSSIPCSTTGRAAVAQSRHISELSSGPPSRMSSAGRLCLAYRPDRPRFRPVQCRPRRELGWPSSRLYRGRRD